jgi:hypothetical protein
MKVALTDDDLLNLLDATEDAFVERKLLSDSSDWLRTAVAFANSAPIDSPAVMFVGVKDNGTLQDIPDPPTTINSIMQKIGNAYPPIYALPKVVTKNGKRAIAVIIPGSERRPHFAGQAYVREGTSNEPASKEQFARLVASHLSVVRELLDWRGKSVSIWWPTRQGSGYGPSTGAVGSAKVADCNQFYLTLDNGVTYSIDSFLLGLDAQSGSLQIRMKAPTF